MLGLAEALILASSMAHIDGNIQATGSQIANYQIGNYFKLDAKKLIIFTKVGMLVLTVLASWLSCMELPALFSLAILAYQGIIQLAAEQFMGIFWNEAISMG